LKESAKKAVTGTWLEAPARWLWSRLQRAGDVALDLEDVWTIDVMSRVLEDDSNCVDIGCAKGKILSHMLRLAPRGTHFAFEPQPQDADELRRCFPSVRVQELALGDFHGESDFQQVVTNPGYSGFRRRRYPSEHETVATIRVRVEKLDDVIPDDVPIRFVKIDVEGAELLVLRGAREILRKQRPCVVFEHGKGAAEYYDTTPQNVYDFLVGTCALRVSLLPDWLAGKPPLDRDGFASQFGGRHWYFIAHP
jgi:FkbM family methyltransferase